MTIEEIKNIKKEMLTPTDVASILECDPHVIRRQAKIDIHSLGFSCARIGSRIKIPRKAFIAWYEGNNNVG